LPNGDADVMAGAVEAGDIDRSPGAMEAPA